MLVYWIAPGLIALAIAIFAYVMPGFRRAWAAFASIGLGIMLIATSIPNVLESNISPAGVFGVAAVWAGAVTIFLVGVKVAWKGV